MAIVGKPSSHRTDPQVPQARNWQTITAEADEATFKTDNAGIPFGKCTIYATAGDVQLVDRNGNSITLTLAEAGFLPLMPAWINSAATTSATIIALW